MANKVTVLFDANTKGAKDNIGSLSKEFEKLTGISAKTALSFTGLGIAVGAAVRFVAANAKEWINLSSDMAETTSKVGVIFGESAESIDLFAQSAARGLGQSEKQAMDAAATFAVFGKSAGLAGGELVNFSTKLVTLSADLASFSNTTPEEAITAIGAALRGESEPIRRYGVLLDDATLRQKAFEMGIIDTIKKALTPQQKALASYQVILDQTADAQGDFTRTSGGLANQQRILEAQTLDLKTALGDFFTPATVKAVTALNGLVEWTQKAVDKQELLNEAVEKGLMFKNLGIIYNGGSIALEDLIGMLDEYDREIDKYTRMQETAVIPATEAATRAVNDHAESIQDVMGDYEDWDHQADISTEKVEVSFKEMTDSVDRNMTSMIDGILKDMQWIAEGGLKLQAELKAVMDKVEEDTKAGFQYAAAGAVNSLNEIQVKAQIMEDDINGIDVSQSAKTISETLGISLQAALNLVNQIRANAQFDITSYVRVVFSEEHGGERTGESRVGGEAGDTGGRSGDAYQDGNYYKWYDPDRKAAGGPVLPGGTYLVGEAGPELLSMGRYGGQVTPINNYNLTIHSNARSEQVASSFALMKAMA